MKPGPNWDFIDSIRNDLKELANLLENVGVSADPRSLRDAAADVKPSKDGNSWRYEVTQLTMKVGDGVRSTPAVTDLSCTIDLVMEGVFSQGSEISLDIVKKLDVQFEFLGKLKSRAEVAPLRQNWHFDRHKFCDTVRTKEVEGIDFESCGHPLYHLTYGGKRARDLFSKNPGGLFVTDTFRIAQPPMDAVLAVDFVISNFSKQAWRALAQDSGYVEMIRRSQELFWKPYFLTIGKHWTNPGQSASQVLFPHLV